LIKVTKPITFSQKIVPICLPINDKFPDEKGTAYVAGWGLHGAATEEQECATGEMGPDPNSKCKFPFFIDNKGGVPYNQCLKTKSPSRKNKDCQEFYKMIAKSNPTASYLDKNYERVNTEYRYILKLLTLHNISFDLVL
jgi:hypothetical protein